MTDEEPQEETCWWCGQLIVWKESDKRASKKGSWVSPDGKHVCPEGYLHERYAQAGA